jgi:uncharacterized protein
MTEIHFEAIKEHVLSRLERGLSPKLYYHGIHHTRDDVLPAAIRLARLAKIGEKDFLLIETAALYHDIGYLETYREHEAAGARIASEELPQLGYTPEQVQKIADMIMATRMPQTPRTDLEMLICDADLDSLGRDDFFVTSHSLRLELIEMGIYTSVREWYTRQLNFLQGHRYHSAVGRELREEGKQKIIRELRDVLGVNSDK